MLDPKSFLIITINRNNASGLYLTLLSVREQSFKDYSMVVIDGASSDGSISVIKDFHDIIHSWVSEPDNGIYHAMNKGTSMLSGQFDYVVYLNSGDELYDKNTLQLVSDFIKVRSPLNQDIIYGSTVLSDKTKPTESLSLNLCRQLSYFKVNMPMHHQAVYFPQSLLNRAPYDETYKYSGDYHLLARLYMNNNSFIYLDMPLAKFDTSGSTYSPSRQKVNSKENMLIKTHVLKQSWFKVYVDSVWLAFLNFARQYEIYKRLYQFYISSSRVFKKIRLSVLKLFSLLSLRRLPLFFIGVVPGVEHFKILKLLSNKGVNTVFDIGANRGQFFTACIACMSLVSYYGFEPLSSANRLLARVTSLLGRKLDIHLFPIVLADCRKKLTFFVTKKSDCSSYMEPLAHSFSPSAMSYSQKNVVQLYSRTLDEFIPSFDSSALALVKLDVQGAELDVLKGARSLLSQASVKWIYCEVSEVEHYQGQCTFDEVMKFLREYDFYLHSLFNCNRLKDGTLLYADALLMRAE